MKVTVNTNNSVAQQQTQRCQEVGFPGGSAVKSPLATWVPSLIREDPTCGRTTKPAPIPELLKPARPRACAQEKSPQREACTLQLEKKATQQQRPRTARNKQINKIIVQKMPRSNHPKCRQNTAVKKPGHGEITVFCYCSCLKSMPNKIVKCYHPELMQFPKSNGAKKIQMEPFRSLTHERFKTSETTRCHASSSDTDQWPQGGEDPGSTRHGQFYKTALLLVAPASIQCKTNTTLTHPGTGIHTGKKPGRKYWQSGLPIPLPSLTRELRAGLLRGSSLCCYCCVASVVSDSVRPHRRQPTRPPVPGILQARTLEWGAISFSNA